jgi:hypothetical protein
MNKLFIVPLIAAAAIVPAVANAQAGVDPNTPNACTVIKPAQYKAILGVRPIGVSPGVNGKLDAGFTSGCAFQWYPAKVGRNDPRFRKVGIGVSVIVELRGTDFFYEHLVAETKKGGHFSKVPGLGKYAYVQRLAGGPGNPGGWAAHAVNTAGWEILVMGDLKLTKAQMVRLLKVASKQASAKSNVGGPICHQGNLDRPGCKQPEFGANLAVDGASSPADAGSQPAVPDNSGVPPDQQPQDPTSPPAG